MFINRSFRLLTEYHSFLLKLKSGTILELYYRFPSPYGVSFILILNIYVIEWVLLLVSVSLRSIIHSYLGGCTMNKIKSKYVSFRLLTEYHSFLSSCNYSIKFFENKSFRLLTEYHSFLYMIIFDQCILLLYFVSVSLRSIIHSYNYFLS